METPEQLTLGALIDKLEPLLASQADVKEKYNHEATVLYDFGGLFPTAIDSWRGSYDELALDYKSHSSKDEAMSITEFVKMLKEAVGKRFTGYKGGEFMMSRETPLWVANYGNSGKTAVVDVADLEYSIILITGLREF